MIIARIQRVFCKVEELIYCNKSKSWLNYLITVDYLSGYIECDWLPSKHVSHLIYSLKVQFAWHGLPLELVLYNNLLFSQFRSFATRSENVPSQPQHHFRVSAAREVVSTTKTPFHTMHDFNAKRQQRTWANSSETMWQDEINCPGRHALTDLLAIVCIRHTAYWSFIPWMAGTCADLWPCTRRIAWRTHLAQSHARLSLVVSRRAS